MAGRGFLPAASHGGTQGWAVSGELHRRMRRNPFASARRRRIVHTLYTIQRGGAECHEGRRGGAGVVPGAI